MKELLALNVYFRRYAGKMLFGVFCIVLSNMVGVYVAVFVREGLNEAVVHRQTAAGLGGEALMGMVYTAAAGFVILLLIAAALKGLFMYLMRQSIVVVSRKVEYDLKNDLYNHYQRLGLSDGPHWRRCEQCAHVRGTCRDVFCKYHFYIHNGDHANVDGQYRINALGVDTAAVFEL